MNRAARVAEQSDFHQRNFVFLIKLIYILIVVAFGLIGLLFYQHFTKPAPQYFITTTDGRLIEITPNP